jgi:hypothetical protein
MAMLSRRWLPLIAIGTALAMRGVDDAVNSIRRTQAPPAMRLLFTVVLIWAAIWWIREETKTAGLKQNYCYGAAAAWAYPFMLPYYLFKLRGLRALAILALLIGIYIGAVMVTGVGYAIVAGN